MLTDPDTARLVLQIVLTAAVSTLFTGIVAFLFQRFIGKWVDQRMAVFTSKLELATWTRRQWWESKAKAYSDIIGGLADIQYSVGLEIDEFMKDHPDYHGPRMTEASTQELWSTYMEAEKLLRKAAAAGAYIVSDDTIAALAELLRVIDSPHQDGFDSMNDVYSATEKSMNKIRGYAKADLQ